MASNKYCEYFDVNESYFPCIDESAINAGAPYWMWNIVVKIYLFLV